MKEETQRSSCSKKMYYNDAKMHYNDVQSSQLKQDPFKTNKIDIKKLANSASEEFEKLYKVSIIFM